ncbi:MAG: hypothetical protein ACXAD7_01800 [Candidatus Kariarchaeaceae archaeon]|jgi:hypothetical protein
MGDQNFFLFILKEQDFKKLKISRILRKRGENIKTYIEVDERDQILIAIKKKFRSDRSIIAEYEIDKRIETEKQIALIFEPIYQAPPHNLVKLDNLLLLRLNSINGIDLWKEALRFPVIQLTERDFTFLSRKLTS